MELIFLYSEESEIPSDSHRLVLIAVTFPDDFQDVSVFNVLEFPAR